MSKGTNISTIFSNLTRSKLPACLKYFRATLSAQTEFNRLGIIQGHQDTPLSPVGVEQSKCTGNHLRNVKFDLVFTSDLQRAKQTASEIVKCNRKANSLQVVPDQLLRERTFGVAEGKPKSFLVEEARRCNFPVDNFLPDGAETNDQIRSRWRLFVNKLLAQVTELHQKVEGETKFEYDVLVVSHGSFMRQAIQCLWCIDGANPLEANQVQNSIPNASINKFQLRVNLGPKSNMATCDFTNEHALIGLTCDYLNYKSHLDAEDSVVAQKTLCDL